MGFLLNVLRKCRPETSTGDTAALARRLCVHAGRICPAAKIRKAIETIQVNPEIFELVQADPKVWLDFPPIFKAWNFYGDLARAYWRADHPEWQMHPAFAENNFYEGQFPALATERFVKEVLASPQVPFSVYDGAPGYYVNLDTQLNEGKYNDIFVFRDMSPGARAALTECLASVVPVVTQCLGAHWRMVQTRYWETKAGGEGIGTNGWHNDGFPQDAIKILSFFSEVDEQKGTTQFKLKDGTIRTFQGPPGKWLLFRNSVIDHCGSPPLPPNGNRLTVEITLAPALATDATPKFAGTNGHYPYVPWLNVDRLR
jgi:hypothetical protein